MFDWAKDFGNWIVDKGKDAVDAVTGVTDKVTDAITDKVEEVTETVTSGISSQISEGIIGAVTGWVSELLDWVLSAMNEVVFSVPENDFVSNVTTFLASFTSIFAVVLVLYKIIEYIINTQNGTQQYPLDEILLRAVKSAGAILVLPWFLKLVFFEIALNLANGITDLGTDLEGGETHVAILTTLMTSQVFFSGGLILVIMLIFFLVAFIAFMYSVCVFYADYTIMMILTAPVALSMIADDNNYFQIWWREMLSMVTSMLVKLFLVTLMVNIVFKGGNILLAIGAGALLIKSPSVLKNMWYAGGGVRGAHQSGGRMRSMGTSMMMSAFNAKMMKGPTK